MFTPGHVSNVFQKSITKQAIVDTGRSILDIHGLFYSWAGSYIPIYGTVNPTKCDREFTMYMKLHENNHSMKPAFFTEFGRISHETEPQNYISTRKRGKPLIDAHGNGWPRSTEQSGAASALRALRAPASPAGDPRSRMHTRNTPPPRFNTLSTREITSFVGFFCSLRGPVCRSSIHPSLPSPPPFRCVEVAAIPWCRSLRGLAGNTVIDPRSGASWLSLCVTVLSRYVESF